MYLICGLPNAGKTTYSRKFHTVLHQDETEDIWNAVKDAPRDVCVEGLYNGAKWRKRFVKFCADKRPNICIWLDVPLDECVARENRNRSGWFIDYHAQHFEPPTYAEGWDEIIQIDGTGIRESLL